MKRLTTETLRGKGNKKEKQMFNPSYKETKVLNWQQITIKLCALVLNFKFKCII
jgi:hypothetical protein